MQIDSQRVKFERVRLPGRAGKLQEQGAEASLVRELGDNYGIYHEFLHDELAKTGRPKREDFDDVESFLAAWDRAHEIVLVEALLRTARAHRQSGRRLDASLDRSVPLVDGNDRLVSVE
jgi:hypothetical protein